ncbi:ComEC/Rec2 family competence protein [Litorisediminicola beolgyonensis]|uniref:ComEC/Rec2 family competence protein n=1 Tax=Litorisediminicola beolgyonensis TaxID=1173614 RepID=A0ABW3ZNC9_9RHOB
MTWLRSPIPGQHGALFPWAPVFLAMGIGLYISLRQEPPVALLWVSGGAGLAGLVLARRVGATLGPLMTALALVTLGMALAGARAHRVAGPVLDYRYYGPIEGRVVAIDRSYSDALRLTLDRVVLFDTAPDRTPLRVRVSLHGDQRWLDPEPGMTVILTGHLSAPNGPAEPGGFDFRRHAWFQRIGAVGYTRTPVLMIEPAGRGVVLARLRTRLADRIKARLPGETGGFAAAILTGDRSAVGRETLSALRDSNLAHLLAISGLHMGLLAGTVFGALRLALLSVPALGLRVPAKKIAALGALAAAGGYLALSGANVATVRAFVMVAVILGAVLVDRRALSLRAVALAATILLVITPEALFGSGFQMSFAATTALVVVFGLMRGKLRGWPAPLRWGATLVLSSAVAGAATAPVAMAQFNRIAEYGLLANLASVPLMGALVMPSGVAALALMPFGGEALPLWVMGRGLDWILWVAESVSALPGAVGHVPAPPGAVLPLLAFGALVLCLWQGRARIAGLAPSLVAVWLWAGAERPVLLVSGDGALVGVMTEAGRALSRESGAGFVAGIWLENDGDGADQAEGFARWPGASGKSWAVLERGTLRLRHLRGKTGLERLGRCAAGEIVVTDREADVSGGCLLLSAKELAATGAVAWYPDGAGLRAVTTGEISGQRLWTPKLDQENPARSWDIRETPLGFAAKQEGRQARSGGLRSLNMRRHALENR